MPLFDPASGDRARLEQARALVERMKTRRRGPFDQRPWWYLDDPGAPPRPAPGRVPGAVQFATHTAERDRLAAWGWSVGTVFVALPWAEFWDAEHAHDRLRQLPVERFLVEADDGWVVRRARTLRGRVQIEHEERFGQALLERLLAQSGWLKRSSNFLLAREVVRAVPYDCGATDRTRTIRRLSDAIGRAHPEFFDLRTRIHGAPGPDEAREARAWLDAEGDRLDVEMRTSAEALVYGLDALVSPSAWRARLDDHLAALVDDEVAPVLAAAARALVATPPDIDPAAALLGRLRAIIDGSTDGPRNVRLMSVSFDLEEAVRAAAFAALGEPLDHTALLGWARALLPAVYGTGLLTAGESQVLTDALARLADDRATAPGPQARLPAARTLNRAAGWMAGAVRHAGGAALARYVALEPRAAGYVDEVVRGSVALPFAEVSARLVGDAESRAGLEHRIDGAPAAGVSGLVAGSATGRLRSGPFDPADVQPDDIVVPQAPTSALPRVAGLLLVGIDNALSHLALLAGGLGVPTALVSPTLGTRLRDLDGQLVHYTVGHDGTVELRRVTARSPSVPRDPAVQVATPPSIDRERVEPMPLSAVEPALRGVVVGSKSATAAAIARLMPDAVPAGLVVPFGVFLDHLRPDLWPGGTDADRRAHLAEMRFSATFRRALRAAGDRVFGRGWPRPVYVRSDGRGEDDAVFSGAGLNLTVPAVSGFESVLAAVRRVWASPFAERAATWRRAAAMPLPLPGVLLMEAVPVHCSGVLVTRGLYTGGPGPTIATAWGVGGAVDGEPAEIWERDRFDRWHRISEAKAVAQRIVLAEGGIRRRPAPMGPVLTAEQRARLTAVAAHLGAALPAILRGPGPLDIEFGFRGAQLWIFQARPFVSPAHRPAGEAPAGVDRRRAID